MSWQLILWTILLTGAIELLSCLLRFTFGLRTARDTRWLSRWTLGYRVHHGYVGLVMPLACLGWLPWRSPWCAWGVVLGAALVFSDLLHHGVLWLVTGSPQFDLRYAADGE
jgi:hypothetical protein